MKNTVVIMLLVFLIMGCTSEAPRALKQSDIKTSDIFYRADALVKQKAPSPHFGFLINNQLFWHYNQKNYVLDGYTFEKKFIIQVAAETILFGDLMSSSYFGILTRNQAIRFVDLAHSIPVIDADFSEDYIFTAGVNSLNNQVVLSKVNLSGEILLHHVYDAPFKKINLLSLFLFIDNSNIFVWFPGSDVIWELDQDLRKTAVTNIRSPEYVYEQQKNLLSDIVDLYHQSDPSTLISYCQEVTGQTFLARPVDFRVNEDRILLSWVFSAFEAPCYDGKTLMITEKSETYILENGSIGDIIADNEKSFYGFYNGKKVYKVPNRESFDFSY